MKKFYIGLLLSGVLFSQVSADEIVNGTEVAQPGKFRRVLSAVADVPSNIGKYYADRNSRIAAESVAASRKYADDLVSRYERDELRGTLRPADDTTSKYLQRNLKHYINGGFAPKEWYKDIQAYYTQRNDDARAALENETPYVPYGGTTNVDKIRENLRIANQIKEREQRIENNRRARALNEFNQLVKLQAAGPLGEADAIKFATLKKSIFGDKEVPTASQRFNLRDYLSSVNWSRFSPDWKKLSPMEMLRKRAAAKAERAKAIKDADELVTENEMLALQIEANEQKAAEDLRLAEEQKRLLEEQRAESFDLTGTMTNAEWDRIRAEREAARIEELNKPQMLS